MSQKNIISFIIAAAVLLLMGIPNVEGQTTALPAWMHSAGGSMNDPSFDYATQGLSATITTSKEYYVVLYNATATPNFPGVLAVYNATNGKKLDYTDPDAQSDQKKIAGYLSGATTKYTKVAAVGPSSETSANSGDFVVVASEAEGSIFIVDVSSMRLVATKFFQNTPIALYDTKPFPIIFERNQTGSTLLHSSKSYFISENGGNADFSEIFDIGSATPELVTNTVVETLSKRDDGWYTALLAVSRNGELFRIDPTLGSDLELCHIYNFNVNLDDSEIVTAYLVSNTTGTHVCLVIPRSDGNGTDVHCLIINFNKDAISCDVNPVTRDFGKQHLKHDLVSLDLSYQTATDESFVAAIQKKVDKTNPLAIKGYDALIFKHEPTSSSSSTAASYNLTLYRKISNIYNANNIIKDLLSTFYVPTLLYVETLNDFVYTVYNPGNERGFVEIYRANLLGGPTTQPVRMNNLYRGQYNPLNFVFSIKVPSLDEGIRYSMVGTLTLSIANFVNSALSCLDCKAVGGKLPSLSSADADPCSPQREVQPGNGWTIGLTGAEDFSKIIISGNTTFLAVQMAAKNPLDPWEAILSPKQAANILAIDNSLLKGATQYYMEGMMLPSILPPTEASSIYPKSLHVSTSEVMLFNSETGKPDWRRSFKHHANFDVQPIIGTDYFYVVTDWGSAVYIFNMEHGQLVHTVNVSTQVHCPDKLPKAIQDIEVPIESIIDYILKGNSLSGLSKYFSAALAYVAQKALDGSGNDQRFSYVNGTINVYPPEKLIVAGTFIEEENMVIFSLLSTSCFFTIRNLGPKTPAPVPTTEHNSSDTNSTNATTGNLTTMQPTPTPTPAAPTPQPTDQCHKPAPPIDYNSFNFVVNSFHILNNKVQFTEFVYYQQSDNVAVFGAAVAQDDLENQNPLIFLSLEDMAYNPLYENTSCNFTHNPYISQLNVIPGNITFATLSGNYLFTISQLAFTSWLCVVDFETKTASVLDSNGAFTCEGSHHIAVVGSSVCWTGARNGIAQCFDLPTLEKSSTVFLPPPGKALCGQPVARSGVDGNVVVFAEPYWTPLTVYNQDDGQMIATFPGTQCASPVVVGNVIYAACWQNFGETPRLTAFAIPANLSHPNEARVLFEYGPELSLTPSIFVDIMSFALGLSFYSQEKQLVPIHSMKMYPRLMIQESVDLGFGSFTVLDLAGTTSHEDEAYENVMFCANINNYTTTTYEALGNTSVAHTTTVEGESLLYSLLVLPLCGSQQCPEGNGTYATFANLSNLSPQQVEVFRISQMPGNSKSMLKGVVAANVFNLTAPQGTSLERMYATVTNNSILRDYLNQSGKVHPPTYYEIQGSTQNLLDRDGRVLFSTDNCNVHQSLTSDAESCVVGLLSGKYHKFQLHFIMDGTVPLQLMESYRFAGNYTWFGPVAPFKPLRVLQPREFVLNQTYIFEYVQMMMNENSTHPHVQASCDHHSPLETYRNPERLCVAPHADLEANSKYNDTYCVEFFNDTWTMVEFISKEEIAGMSLAKVVTMVHLGPLIYEDDVKREVLKQVLQTVINDMKNGSIMALPEALFGATPHAYVISNESIEFTTTTVAGDETFSFRNKFSDFTGCGHNVSAEDCCEGNMPCCGKVKLVSDGDGLQESLQPIDFIDATTNFIVEWTPIPTKGALANNWAPGYSFVHQKIDVDALRSGDSSAGMCGTGQPLICYEECFVRNFNDCNSVLYRLIRRFLYSRVRTGNGAAQLIVDYTDGGKENTDNNTQIFNAWYGCGNGSWHPQTRSPGASLEESSDGSSDELEVDIYNTPQYLQGFARKFEKKPQISFGCSDTGRVSIFAHAPGYDRKLNISNVHGSDAYLGINLTCTNCFRFLTKTASAQNVILLIFASVKTIATILISHFIIRTFPRPIKAVAKRFARMMAKMSGLPRVDLQRQFVENVSSAIAKEYVHPSRVRERLAYLLDLAVDDVPEEFSEFYELSMCLDRKWIMRDPRDGAKHNNSNFISHPKGLTKQLHEVFKWYVACTLETEAAETIQEFLTYKSGALAGERNSLTQSRLKAANDKEKKEGNIQAGASVETSEATLCSVETLEREPEKKKEEGPAANELPPPTNEEKEEEGSLTHKEESAIITLRDTLGVAAEEDEEDRARKDRLEREYITEHATSSAHTSGVMSATGNSGKMRRKSRKSFIGSLFSSSRAFLVEDDEGEEAGKNSLQSPLMEKEMEDIDAIQRGDKSAKHSAKFQMEDMHAIAATAAITEDQLIHNLQKSVANTASSTKLGEGAGARDRGTSTAQSTSHDFHMSFSSSGLSTTKTQSAVRELQRALAGFNGYHTVHPECFEIVLLKTRIVDDALTPLEFLLFIRTGLLIVYFMAILVEVHSAEDMKHLSFVDRYQVVYYMWFNSTMLPSLVVDAVQQARHSVSYNPHENLLETLRTVLKNKYIYTVTLLSLPAIITHVIPGAVCYFYIVGIFVAPVAVGLKLRQWHQFRLNVDHVIPSLAFRACGQMVVLAAFSFCLSVSYNYSALSWFMWVHPSKPGTVSAARMPQGESPWDRYLSVIVWDLASRSFGCNLASIGSGISAGFQMVSAFLPFF